MNFQKTRLRIVFRLMAFLFLIAFNIITTNQTRAASQPQDSDWSISSASRWFQTLDKGLNFTIKDIIIRVKNPNVDAYYSADILGYLTPDYANGYIGPVESYSFSNLGVSTPAGFDGYVTLTALSSFPLNPNRYYIISISSGDSSRDFYIGGSASDSYPNGKAYYGNSYPCSGSNPEINCNSGESNGVSDIFFKFETADSFLGTESLLTEIHTENMSIDGDIIAWKDYKNGLPNGIHAYNLSTKENIIVTESKFIKSGPFVSGRKIVWSQTTTEDPYGFVREKAIYMYDLDSNPKVATEIIPAERIINSMDFDGEHIVWSEYDNSGNSEIYLYDIFSTAITFIDKDNINIAQDKIIDPKIFHNKIIYLYSYYSQELRLYDIVSGEKTTVTTAAGYYPISNYALEGDNIIFAVMTRMNYYGGPGQETVYRYKIPNKELSVLGKVEGPIFGLDISGDAVVWSDGYDIFIYDFISGKSDRTGMESGDSNFPKISNNNVVWQDYRNTTGAGIYRYEFIDFKNELPPLSFSLDPGFVFDGVDGLDGTNEGFMGADFIFKVVYTNEKNIAPQSIDVVISRETIKFSLPMILDKKAYSALNDGDYTNGEQYVLYSPFLLGKYYYYFEISDGSKTTMFPQNEDLSFEVKNRLPMALFEYTPENPEAGQEIIFDASSSYDLDGEIIRYEWDWDDDGQTDEYTEGSIIKNKWLAKGLYSVRLRVVDDYGSVNFIEKQINVTESPASAIASYVFNSFWGVGNWTQDLVWHDTTDMVKIDTWLRDRDGDGQPDLASKPFDWLQDSEFSYLQKENETILIPILNQEMVVGSNLTYRQTILNIIHEQEMAEKALIQQTPRYPLKIIAGLVPGGNKLILNNETLSGIKGVLDYAIFGAGEVLVGLYKYGTGLMGIKNLYDKFQDINEWKYNEALSAYFRERSLGKDSDAAWNYSPQVLLSTQMDEDMLAATRTEFEEWWQKYTVDVRNKYNADWNANGLPNVFKQDVKTSVTKLILYALKNHIDKLPKSLIIQTYSPVEIHVYDSLGRVAGLVNGEVKEEIPNSIYDKENERLMIFAPAGDYHYNFVGTDSGMYKVEIINAQGEKPIYFDGSNIPTTPGQNHGYSIDWNALANNENGVIMQIDKEGDGTFEQTINIGAEFSDTTASTSNISISGTKGNNGWYTSGVWAELSAQDNEGGIGMEKIEYSLDNGKTWFQYGESFGITEDGIHKIFYRSQDFFGNIEEIKNEEVKIDKTPPEITGAVIMPPNDNDWYDSNPTIHFNGTDFMSGIDIVTPDIIITAEGANQSATGTATDQAGNSVSFTVDKINIDKTPPVVSINLPLDGNIYLLNQVVLADWSVTDELSGIDSAIGTNPRGSIIDTSSVGEKTFTVASQDMAGNSMTKTVTYFVHYDFSGVLPPVKIDGSSVFKLGSTIPTKFQLKNTNGDFIPNAVAYIYVAKISNVITDNQEIVSAGEANIGNLFRYDSADNQYIFNLGTKNLSVGTWQLIIELDDGTENKANLSLK